MKKILISPEEVYGYMPRTNPDRVEQYLTRIRYGHKIQDIPIFRIPDQYSRETGFQYLLADGHHRKDAYIILNGPCQARLYKSGEQMDPIAHDIAPFRHCNDPYLFEKLLRFFKYRAKISEILINK